METSVCGAVTNRINQLLGEKNWTLYKLAQESGVLYDTLKKIVSNKNKAVNLAIIIQIANGFGMTLSQFANTHFFSIANLKID
jgi:transcriptional regulator with XRE-family HTH domain